MQKLRYQTQAFNEPCIPYDPKFEYYAQTFDLKPQKLIVKNQYLVFFTVFLARFRRFFSLYKVKYKI